MRAQLSISQLVRSIRRLEQYEAWKREVFVRDRFSCQRCGRRNGRKRVIEADHIKPLAQLVREHDISSVADALICPVIWDANNGRTLCHDCHELTESYPSNFHRKKEAWELVRWL